MAYSTYRSNFNSGPTKMNRTSWGPVSTPTQVENGRRLSGNYDRINNLFDRTNEFEYVRSTFEQRNTNNNNKGISIIGINGSEKAKYNADKTTTVNINTTLISRPTVMFEKQPEENRKRERFVGFSDVIVNGKGNNAVGSSFERADVGLASRQTPCSDEDVTAYYQDRLYMSQARQLFPLQEDLADWINKTIGITYLTGENFLEVLDNGVELCQLASVIRDKAQEAFDKGIYNGVVPHMRGRCWQRAARRSFFSRDNMENFINFCRQLGVHENLLFESDDLVLHAQPRNVILCLLELARIATKFQVEPPGLVQLEREIALEEEGAMAALQDNMASSLGWQFQPESGPDPSDNTTVDPPPSSPIENEVSLPVALFAESEGTPSVHTDDTWSRGTPEDPDSVPLKPLSELDKRVQIVTRLMQRNCNCSEGKCSKLLKVKKVGEGRYNIAGRNVFIRLLKGRHMMVRVGGGWDTLEHFLTRHDPCQVRVISPQSSNSIQKVTTVNLERQSSAISTVSADSVRTNNTSQSSDRNSVGDISPAESNDACKKPRRVSSTNKPRLNGTNKDTVDGKISPNDSNSETSSVNGSISSSTLNTMRTIRSYLANGKSVSVSKSSSSNTSKNSSGRTTPLSNGKVSPSHSTPSRRISCPPRFNEKMSPASLKLDLTPNHSISRSRIVNNRMESPLESSSRLLSASKNVQTGRTVRTPTNSGRKSFPSASSNSDVVLRRRSINIPLPSTDPRSIRSPTQPSRPLKSPINPKSSIANRSNSLKLPVTANKPLVSPSSIEETVRMALPIQGDSENKPFLHIRAKYRSPPPRDIPPR